MTVVAGTLQTMCRLSLSWLFIVASAFILLRLMPGDPVEIFLSETNIAANSKIVATYRAQWGVDGSIIGQFVRWIGGFLTLDWGTSFETGRPVAVDLAARLPYSVAIGVGAMALAVPSGFVLGFLAAHRPGGIADTISRALAVAGQTLPAFAVGLVALWILGVRWRLINPFGGGPVERILLPMLLVAFYSIGSTARLARAGFLDVKYSPYFHTALAKGRTHVSALWVHGRASAGLALIAGLAPELSWVIGGTAVAEIVFGVPGVSERVVQAVAHRDYAVLQPFVALVALWIVFVLTCARLIRRALDPRIT